MKQNIVVFFAVCYCVLSFGQTPTDSIQFLDEIELSDVKLKRNAAGFKVTVLNDSVLNKNTSTFTDLLRFNSNIYFKENGFGMVSSPSFRGTNASQTAVIWNGININSQLNGQTDFNTINTTNFSSVDIKSGGGSVQYGSGSIGGTVHLNNKLQFINHFNSTARVSLGSFNTKQYSLSTDFGNTNFAGNIGVSYVDSDNDYKYLDTDLTNQNGAFNNQNINANLGYFISDTDVLKLYHQTFFSDRNFSGTLVAPSKSGYKDFNYRNMLEWSHIGTTIQSKFKVAHLHEEYKYFENKEKANFSFGKVNTLVLKHDLNYDVSDKIALKSILEYNTIDGEGGSFGSPNRQVFSATALLQHNPTEKITYGLNLRKDFTSGFTSPLVFSVDSKIQLAKNYAIKINASKNYRVPTFNDLFWQPGGNPDLVPESSYQIDLGQELNYKKINLKLNAYYITTSDLIQWRPNTSGLWSPINIAETEHYGVEAELGFKQQFKNHNLELKGLYSHTIAEDKTASQQLLYVPFHKANANLSYGYKQFSMYYQHLFNGEVFTLSRDELPFYNVSNLGIAYNLNSKGNTNYIVELKVNNLFNTYYENVALRPMPNRSFTIQTTIKF